MTSSMISCDRRHWRSDLTMSRMQVLYRDWRIRTCSWRDRLRCLVLRSRHLSICLRSRRRHNLLLRILIERSSLSMTLLRNLTRFHRRRIRSCLMIWSRSLIICTDLRENELNKNESCLTWDQFKRRLKILKVWLKKFKLRKLNLIKKSANFRSKSEI